MLIVSGGNEVRIGAHRGMATLAAMLSERDIAVFRYDRRGVGDSNGSNLGSLGAAADLAAAAAAFRAQAPSVRQIVGFGNCDAATALAYHHRGAAIDRLVLANPWLGDADDDGALPPAAAIAARYAARLRDPRDWLRLLRGRVDLVKLRGGVIKLLHSRSPTNARAVGLARVLSAAATPTTVLLAARDNVALAFTAAWPRATAKVETRINVERLDSESHSFASPSDRRWLFDQLCDAVDRTC